MVKISYIHEDWTNVCLKLQFTHFLFPQEDHFNDKSRITGNEIILWKSLKKDNFLSYLLLRYQHGPSTNFTQSSDQSVVWRTRVSISQMEF